MQIELTNRGLIAAFFRQRDKFLGVFLLIVLGGIGYILFATPLYEGSGSLLVKFGHDAGADVTREGTPQDQLSQNDRREIMQSNTEILESHDLLQAVIGEFGVERLYPGLTEKVAGSDLPMEAAIRRLIKDDLTVKSGQQSDVIEVHLLNRDPRLAAAFVRRLMDLFIARQSEVYNKPQTAFMQEEAQRALAKLESSQAQLEAFKGKAGLSSIEEELAQLLKEKSDAAQIAYQGVDDGQSRIAELEAKKSDLLMTYRADSPQARQLDASIALARRQLEARQSDLRAGRAGVLGGHLAVVDARIAALEAQRSQYNDLLRQVQIDEENYKTYVTHSEEARVNETLNKKKITRVSVVDEPVVAMKPARPRKMIVLGVCLMGGLVFGLGAAVGFEAMDERFSRPEQIPQVLGVPVMASFAAPKAGKA